MKTIFRHRDSLNYFIYFNGKKLKFIDGRYTTSDEAEINHIKALDLFGLKEDGAVIYEMKEKENSPTIDLASKNLQIGEPPKYNPSNEQPLYPTKGAFYECVIDGSLHGNPEALVKYIKDRYGVDKYNSMEFLLEPPVIKPFGKKPNNNPKRKLFTAEEVKGMTVAPVVGVYPIKGEITERKDLRQISVEQADLETERLIEEEAKKVAASAKKRELEKRKVVIETAMGRVEPQQEQKPEEEVENPEPLPKEDEEPEQEDSVIQTESVVEEKKPVKKIVKKKAKKKVKRKAKRKTKK